MPVGRWWRLVLRQDWQSASLDQEVTTRNTPPASWGTEGWGGGGGGQFTGRKVGMKLSAFISGAIMQI